VRCGRECVYGWWSVPTAVPCRYSRRYTSATRTATKSRVLTACHS
jgi:hypothetical protein